MKTLYAKFKASTALDEANPPQKEADSMPSPELRQFGESLRTLDQRLKNARPRDEAPADLHPSVMRAVREIARERTVEKQRKASPWLQPAWLAAPALALLLAAALWWFNHSQPSQPPQAPTVAVTPAQPSLAGATDLLKVSDQVVQKASAAALSPLATEVESMKLDFQNMKEFLLASLP